MITQITKAEDISIFAKLLIYEEKLSLHPDDDFKDYIFYETKQQIYSEADADLRNQLMTQCFDVCEKNGHDIYEIFHNEMQQLLVK